MIDVYGTFVEIDIVLFSKKVLPAQSNSPATATFRSVRLPGFNPHSRYLVVNPY